MARLDATRYFYFFLLAIVYRRYFCMRVDIPEGYPVGDKWRPYVQKDARGTFVILQMQRLAMGARSSPAVAQAVSSIVCMVADVLCGGDCTTYPYMDDYIQALLRHVSKERGDEVEEIMAWTMKEAGLDEKKAKRVPQASKVVVMGREVDCAQGTCSLPAEKAFKYLEHLYVVLGLLEEGRTNPAALAEVTRESLSALAGKLEFWARAGTLRGVGYISPLYAVVYHGHRVEARREHLVEALRWWVHQAESGRLKPEVLVGGLFARPEGGGGRANLVQVVRSDAGDNAGAAYLEDKVVFVEFTEEQRGWGSTAREMAPVVEGGKKLVRGGDANTAVTAVFVLDSYSAFLLARASVTSYT